jgi:transketolase
MGAICNGIALHNSGLIPYGATFLIFTDYMRNPIRLSALSETKVLWVMTHDSIALGEDGPTHQPVEQVMSLRLIPELLVFRPADGNETSGAYKAAINADKKSSVFALTRQNLPNLAGSSIDKVAQGAYVLSCGFPPSELELILIGTGSEVALCEEAAQVLRAEGRKVRVVSMPCMELFEQQSAEYKESVLPTNNSAKRLSVEAGSTLGWQLYVGRDGASIGVDTFGASAPGDVIMEKFGFTVANVVAKAKELIGG